MENLIEKLLIINLIVFCSSGIFGLIMNNFNKNDKLDWVITIMLIIYTITGILFLQALLALY